LSESAELAALRGERDELLSRLQHVSADYQNYQKRIQRDMHESREYATAGLIKEMLGVLDDLDLAIEHGKTAHEENVPLMAGLLLVRSNALEVLARHGLTVIDTQGQPFDPNLHQALMQETSTDVTTPTVTRELQRGYMLKGRVIRPAKVAVAMPAEKQ
jgi:molecular chaperone GrpE